MSDETNRAGSPDRLTALWRRAKEHRIGQWTIGYVAVAYGIQHAITLTAEAFEWPNAVIRLSMLLLGLGLPIAITLAWYHGERASRGFSRAEFSILATLLLGVSILFYTFVQPATRTPTAAPAIQEAGVTAARQAAASSKGAISVAVMPFANLSGDAGQDYFSDGMTDEISGALAKIPDLRVVARSSAFRFKGKDQDARTLGKSLGATHLIEGSVRKAGDQLRISAELVKADDGVTVWSNSYDRQLKDVFAVQEDIARAIAASFHMALGLKPGENLVSGRTKDQRSYEAYLGAKALIRRRSFEGMQQAAKLLEPSVARDPGFAPAWGLLGIAYAFIPRFDPARETEDAAHAVPVDTLLTKAESAARMALTLDANNVDGIEALGDVARQQRDYVKAFALYDQALMLDPDSPDILHIYRLLLASLGHVKEAISIGERLRVIEPFVPVFKNISAEILAIDGQTDAAIKLHLQPPAGNNVALAVYYALETRYPEAIDALTKAVTQAPSPALAKQRKDALQLLRSAPGPAPAPEKLPRLGSREIFYMTVGAPGRVLEYEEANLRSGYLGLAEMADLWAPIFAPVRKTERFKKFVRDAGMVEYWHAKGWPPQCHATTSDDFVCS